MSNKIYILKSHVIDLQSHDHFSHEHFPKPHASGVFRVILTCEGERGIGSNKIPLVYVKTKKSICISLHYFLNSANQISYIQKVLQNT